MNLTELLIEAALEGAPPDALIEKIAKLKNMDVAIQAVNDLKKDIADLDVAKGFKTSAQNQASSARRELTTLNKMLGRM